MQWLDQRLYVESHNVEKKIWHSFNIGVGKLDVKKKMVCVCLFVCVRVSRWSGDQYGGKKVTTETRVSKLEGQNPETLHFEVALIPRYQINLTMLSEWPPGRKWVEGHDLASTSQLL